MHKQSRGSARSAPLSPGARPPLSRLKYLGPLAAAQGPWPKPTEPPREIPFPIQLDLPGIFGSGGSIPPARARYFVRYRKDSSKFLSTSGLQREGSRRSAAAVLQPGLFSDAKSRHRRARGSPRSKILQSIAGSLRVSTAAIKDLSRRRPTGIEQGKVLHLTAGEWAELCFPLLPLRASASQRKSRYWRNTWGLQDEDAVGLGPGVQHHPRSRKAQRDRRAAPWKVAGRHDGTAGWTRHRVAGLAKDLATPLSRDMPGSGDGVKNGPHHGDEKPAPAISGSKILRGRVRGERSSNQADSLSSKPSAAGK